LPIRGFIFFTLSLRHPVDQLKELRCVMLEAREGLGYFGSVSLPAERSFKFFGLLGSLRDTRGPISTAASPAARGRHLVKLRRALDGGAEDFHKRRGSQVYTAHAL